MDFSKATILCLGDVMLDRYAYCTAERISPEAPVPVLRLERTRSMLGGVGNVARNVAALGGRAILAGMVGRDAAGEEIAALAAATPRLETVLLPSAARPTTCKTRYLAGQQQMLRVDDESAAALDSSEERRLAAALDRALSEADALVLSDYGKGVLTPSIVAHAIERAHAAGLPVYVDPKSAEFGRYRGADVITPNARELATAARLPTGGDAEIVAAATRILQETGANAVLGTRSEKGLVLVEAGGGVHFEAARAREVFDVSGAGDTVIGVLALAVASGYTLPQAARLANAAAGIVVSKLGTATVELDELRLELARDVRDKDWHQGKHYAVDEAETLVRGWKSRGLSVGFTNGCFDILHAGHVSLLAAARAECDRLIVALNTDASTRRLKGPRRPLNALRDRAAVIAAIEAVDAVISFDEDTPLDLIRRLQPEVLVKGGDYTVETVVGADVVQAAGGRVVLVDLVEGRSTTGLIDAIRTPDRVASGGRRR